MKLFSSYDLDHQTFFQVLEFHSKDYLVKVSLSYNVSHTKFLWRQDKNNQQERKVLPLEKRFLRQYQVEQDGTINSL